MTIVQVTIPGPEASKSKMQKKGWKCWAKLLTGVLSPANSGYDFHGQFCAVADTVEAEPGDVLLHVDESSSSGIGVVLPRRDGAGAVVWLASTTAGKWAGTLAAPARRLLALSPDQRIVEAAAVRVTQLRERLAAGQSVGEGAMEHYERLAAGGVDTRRAVVEQIRALMIENGLTPEDLA